MEEWFCWYTAQHVPSPEVPLGSCNTAFDFLFAVSFIAGPREALCRVIEEVVQVSCFVIAK